MKWIISTFLLLFLLGGCEKTEVLIIPIINHTDSDFYVSISVNKINRLEKIKIEKLSITEQKIKIRIGDVKNYSFVIKVKVEDDTNNLITENIKYFPGGGIVSDSSKGNFFIAMDILLSDKKIPKILYSEDAFKYGFP